MNVLHQNLYGNYRNRKFTDIWSDVDAFMYDYNNNGIINQNVAPAISDDSAKLLYFLLYAKYGNSTVASSDENQFKYRLFSIVFMYGPTWEKRLAIQKEIRELTLEEVQKGGKAIYNTALNPNQNPSTNSLEELNFINQQNTTNYLKSKVDAYAIIIDLLETDVTESFLAEFKKLFLTVVSPELPLWYTTDIQGEQEDDQ